MRKKRAIKRFFLTLMWLGVAAGMVTIITAAMRAQEAGLCKGYKIKITGFGEGMLFTSQDHIVDLLKAATKGDIKGQRKSDFNLPLIEDLLEQSSWVYNADLYFDNNDVLHADVTERKPLARVFTNKGESFYIDEAGKQIPLSEKISLDLPVFTGYPSKKVFDKVDSALIQNVIATASFINVDSFWTSQVAQIDINSCGAGCWNMEMVPVVGSHKVQLGDGSDIASKFHRLYLFYDQVLKRTGFDKYQKIDVQYSGQVIGVKDNQSKVDSLQLRKNIENLLQQSRAYNEMVQVKPNVNYLDILKADSLSDPGPVFDEEGNTEDEAGLSGTKVDVPESKAAIVPVVKKEATKPQVVKKEAGEKKPDAKPIVKPAATAKPATGKPATVKPVVKPAVIKKAEDKKPVAKAAATKTADKKPVAKATIVKKTDSKTAAVKSTSAKKETSRSTVKPQEKKPVPKKEEVKRNVLEKKKGQ